MEKNVEAFANLMLSGTGLDIWAVAILCGVSFLGGFITAGLGLGGGTLVFATMALFLTPTVLIPVHGVVQLGSNVGRAVLFFRHIYFKFVPVFLAGTFLGAVIGGNLFIALPISTLKLILALFILYATWAPKITASDPGKKTFFGLGAIGAFVTMFVGATGTLVMPFAAAACEKRQQVIATHAMLMTVQHALKLITFGILGFAFGPYIPLLVGLLGFGFAGTYAGKHALNLLPEKMFRTGLKIILTLIAIRLFYGALTSMG